jgi:hypothetical protein
MLTLVNAVPVNVKYYFISSISQLQRSDVIDTVGSQGSYPQSEFLIADKHFVGTGVLFGGRVRSRPHSSDHSRAQIPTEPAAPCTSTERPFHRTRNMNGLVRRDTRYAKTGALIDRRAFRQMSDLIQGHHCKLRGRTKRTIRLGSITPYGTAHPFGGNASAKLIYAASAVAMRNHTRIRHCRSQRRSGAS